MTIHIDCATGPVRPVPLRARPRNAVGPGTPGCLPWAEVREPGLEVVP